MDTIFMNSEKRKTSEPHRLLLNLEDKINLKWNDKYIALSNLSMYYTWKNFTKAIILKYQLQHGMDNVIHLMDRILYQIFKIILNKS